MKTVFIVSLLLMINSTCRCSGVEDPSATDARRIAQRAIEWLIYDDWGQEKKQYGHAGLAEGLDRWRSSFSRRKPAAVVVTVYQGDRKSDHFIYDPVSSKMVDSPQPSDFENVRVYITPHKDEGWRVKVSVSLWFFLQITQQNNAFVVRRHETTWIID